MTKTHFELTFILKQLLSKPKKETVIIKKQKIYCTTIHANYLQLLQSINYS